MAAACATLMLVGALGACGSSSKTSSATTTPSTAAGSTPTSAGGSAAPTSTFLSQVAASIKKDYAGTETVPPTTGPKAQKGKTVWVISCGQTTDCAISSSGAMAAGKVLGWKMKLCDGADDANNAFVTCVDAAIAAKVSGIIVVSIDCATIKQALIAAKAAKIPVVNTAGVDCNQNLPAPAGPSLFTASEIVSTTLPTYSDLLAATAKIQADWIINKTAGHAKVLNFDLTGESVGITFNQATTAEFAKCSGCTVYQVPFTLAQSTPQALKGLFQSALLKHPDADALTVIADFAMLGGLASAIKASGKSIYGVTLGNSPISYNLLRENAGISAMVGHDFVWDGWATIDELNRVFAGSPAVAEGQGFQMVDATHNLPKSGGYVTPVDYQADYEKVWGST